MIMPILGRRCGGSKRNLGLFLTTCQSGLILDRPWELANQLYCRFIERDTGARHYFSVPLLKAYKIFNTAYSKIGGVARTVRGPSMTTLGGKLGIAGTPTINGETLFALKFFSARNPAWIERMFFAKLNPDAVWFDQLEPAFGDKEFFWEKECAEIINQSDSVSSGQMFQLAF